VRIAEIGVVVAKIWRKKFRDLFVISKKWSRLNLEIFSNPRGSVWKKIGGLQNNYGQGLGSLCNCSGDFLVLELFLNS
jgi:hypothetical protein